MDIDRELARTKTALFLGNNAAFYGALLCGLNFYWDKEIPTAEVTPDSFKWNPDWFTSLSPDTRKTVLRHELEHIARLHFVRGTGKDQERWNEACDIRINNDLENEKYSFVGIESCCKDHSYDANGIASEEEIYEALLALPVSVNPIMGNDMGEVTPLQKQANINKVTAAVQAAGMAGQGCPGIREILDSFLSPILPWQTLLMQWMTEMDELTHTWKIPNRRHTDMYMPSYQKGESGLEHLTYFIDVSGSVTKEQLVRFNSELKYVQEVIEPTKMDVVQFTTQIKDVREFEKGDEFSFIEIIGRGGTSLECVREYIQEHPTTAAIIFTDLECHPMDELDRHIPIIWICSDNPSATVPFGTLIHI